MQLAVANGDSAMSGAGSSRGQDALAGIGRGRRVLIVDDEDSLRHVLQLLLRKEGYEAHGVASVDAALAELDRGLFDIVITDLRMPGRSGLELVEEVRTRGLGTTVVVMTAYGSREIAIEAVKRGAYDYLSKPFESDELILLLRKAEERERLQRENQSLRRQLGFAGPDQEILGGLVARSAAMKEVFRTIRRIAEFKTTVLLQGESGTGKELVARAIHDESPRAARPFVAVNCGAIPGPLLESELFGHVRGAFTDAIRDRAGLFEQANGGTLLLDEIGDMPVELQVKLLRVLQEGDVRRLGAARGTAVDVRVVAASARNLRLAVAAGGFREDLYYRLNVMTLELPPLRERSEDIPCLVQHFIQRINQRLGLAITGVSAEALRALTGWSWPGNVRELENRLERAMILCEHGTLGIAEVMPSADHDQVEGGPAEDLTIRNAVRRVEEDLIRRALVRTGGNRTRAAERLGLSYRALLYKMKEFGIGRAEAGLGDAADETPGPDVPVGHRGEN